MNLILSRGQNEIIEEVEKLLMQETEEDLLLTQQ